MLSIFVYIVPAVLARFLYLQQPMGRWGAGVFSVGLFVVVFPVKLILNRGNALPGSSFGLVIIASVWSYFILRTKKGVGGKEDDSPRENKLTNPIDTQSRKQDSSSPPVVKSRQATTVSSKRQHPEKMQDDEHIYEQVAAELKDGNRKEGLWLKAQTQAESNADKTQALYVKWRVEQLVEEEEKRRQEEEKEREQEDARRAQQEAEEEEEERRQAEERQLRKKQAEKEELLRKSEIHRYLETCDDSHEDICCLIKMIEKRGFEVQVFRVNSLFGKSPDRWRIRQQDKILEIADNFAELKEWVRNNIKE